MKRLISTAFILATLGACSTNKGGDFLLTAPVGTPASVNKVGGSDPSTHWGSPWAGKPLSLIIGVWTGTATATVGESGSISLEVTSAPENNSVITGNLTWVGGVTATGTVSGTLDAIVITTSTGPCGYTASGVLNEAGTQIVGTYAGTGPGVCSTKAGTFVLNGQSYVAPPPNCGTTSFYIVNVGNPGDKGDGARQNKCENTTNPPGVYVDNITLDGVDYHDVCKFSPVPPGAPGNDLTFIKSTPNICVD